MTLAEASFDLVEVAKLIGSLGATTLLGIAVTVLWLERRDIAAERKTEREESAKALKAAQDKLDVFQDTRIKEQAALIASLTGGKP